VGGFEIESIDMDRQRIDKVSLRRLPSDSSIATRSPGSS
jgi:hypothetical protein